MAAKINVISPANLVIIKSILKKHIPQFDFNEHDDESAIDCVYCCLLDGGNLPEADLYVLQKAGIDINYFDAA